MRYKEILNFKTFLSESIGQMVRGMFVQSPEEFIRNPFGQGKLEEDAVEQPIRFDPKIRPQYSQQIDPSQSRKDSYSKTISPMDVAKIVHHKNSFVVYYEEKSPDDPSKKIRRRVNTEPIYVNQAKMAEIDQQAAQIVNQKYPNATDKQKKPKAYILADTMLKKLVLDDAIKNNAEVKALLATGKVAAKQLKADQFITTGTKVSKPSVHRSSVPIVNDDFEIIYDLDELARSITRRPAEVLKKNAKMKKSSGGDILMANLGIPAISGLVVDERSNEFKVVNTCPGAGVCKNYCYATKGGYIQYRASFESQARVLNFWYNDPEGFKNQIIKEIKSFINPEVDVYIRWHDSGDFFEPAYLNLAFEVARSLPEVNFYAYTKIASVAKNPNMPDNFMINFSQGAKPEETEQIDFKTTKFSEVVPPELFKDEATSKVGLDRLKNRDPEAQRQLKLNLAKHYKIDPKSILTYDEMMQMPIGKPLSYNVTIVPGIDGDLAAARRDVLGSYLLYH